MRYILSTAQSETQVKPKKEKGKAKFYTTHSELGESIILNGTLKLSQISFDTVSS